MTGIIFLEDGELSIGEANGSLLVPIVRTGDLSGSATIEFGITGATATAGVDFLSGTGTVTMAPGQDRALVPIRILNDAISEPTEYVTFSLIAVDGGSTLLFPRTTRVAILDDETPVVDPPEPPLRSSYHVTQQSVVTGLTQPTTFEFAPHDSSVIYIAEKGGKIRVFDLDTGTFLSDFVDISAKVNEYGDRGLMDIALHPDFPNQPYVYAFYVVDPSDTAGNTGNAGPDGQGNRFAYVVRFTADAATGYRTVVPGSEVILLGAAGQTLQDISGHGAVDSTVDFGQPESGRTPSGGYVRDYIKLDSSSHAGGSLAFGPDGALYVSVGDGTSFNAMDIRTLSVQDLNSLSGKILRIDPITGQGLPDNPFATGDLNANQSKVYQLGLRNAFSIGFDQDGQLFLTNTGWNSWEEIESGPPGANFGWPFYEGGDNGVSLRAPEYRDLTSAMSFYAAVASGAVTITPAYRGFSHASADPGFQVQAITGGNVFYTGSQYPAEFQNDYFFADIAQGEVYVIDTHDRRDVRLLYQSGGAPVHFSQGPDGYVYYADLINGVIGRLLIARGQASGSTNDFNGDGISDVLFQHTNGQIYQWQLLGTTVIGASLVGINSDAGWRMAGTGYFNDDGYSDLVFQHATTGQVYQWQLSGTSVIGGGSVGFNSDAGWRIVVIGDFNGDVSSDLLFQHTNGQVYQWQLNGTSVIGGGLVGLNSDAGWRVAGTGYFNEDGYADLLFQHAATGQVYQWQLNGTSLVGGGQVGVASDAGWRVIAVGDFNHDGYSDLLFQHTNGQLYQWQLQGTAIVAAGQVGLNSDAGWRVVEAGDFNRDGTWDILFQHATTGQLYQWQLNGLAVIGHGSVGSPIDVGWQVAT